MIQQSYILCTRCFFIRIKTRWACRYPGRMEAMAPISGGKPRYGHARWHSWVGTRRVSRLGRKRLDRVLPRWELYTTIVRHIPYKKREKRGIPFVSGKKNKTKNHPIIHQAAYHPKAPWGLNEVKSDGQVNDRMKLKHQHVAVAQDIPTSRTCSGKASAE